MYRNFKIVPRYLTEIKSRMYVNVIITDIIKKQTEAVQTSCVIIKTICGQHFPSTAIKEEAERIGE